VKPKFVIGMSLIGIALALPGCRVIGQSSTAPNQLPAATALNSSTDQSTTANAAGNAGQRQGFPGVAGTIQSVNGSTVTVQSARGGQSVTVQLTGATTIQRQNAATISDVKAGQNIFAFGQLSNGVLQARRIQLGGQPPVRFGGGGPGSGGNRNNGGGNGPNGNGNGAGNSGGNGGRGNAVGGTVDSVNGDTINVNTTTGNSVQVQLAANGQMLLVTTGNPSDIAQGKFLVAFGDQQGNTFTATSINVSDSAPAGAGVGTTG
jgi:hypothetical protein